MKTTKFNPFTVNQRAGRDPDDVEVLIGIYWVMVTSISVTHDGVLFWKSEYFLGSNVENTWRWV